MTRVNPMAALEEEDRPDLDSPQPSAPEVRTKPVKVSVALYPRPYYALVDYCASAAKVTGSRVTHVEVMRALVNELLEDNELRERVNARLRKNMRG
jgi:hypothetical protein